MQFNTVVTNGCFDIIHIGHIRLFKYCKTIAEDVIVLMNSDASVKLLGKGKDRPINNEQERYELLTSIKYISNVLIFNEKTPCKILKEIKPQFYVKGGDYKLEEIPEVSIVKEYGGESLLFDHTGHSTTKILKKINGN